MKEPCDSAQTWTRPNPPYPNAATVYSLGTPGPVFHDWHKWRGGSITELREWVLCGHGIKSGC